MKLGKKLNLCPEGYYRIVDIFSVLETRNRLLEIGFLTGQSIYIVRNNSLGIQIRINNAIYLLNEVVASSVYVAPIGK